MWIDMEEAIKIYARVCRRRYGPAAGTKVRERAHELAVIGDMDGEQVWNDVAGEIDKQQADTAAAMEQDRSSSVSARMAK
jgi:hypothetical protein